MARQQLNSTNSHHNSDGDPAIDETMPRKKLSPHSKRWWNDDLLKLRKEANRARNKYRRTRNKRDRQEWKEKRDEFHYEHVKRVKQRT